jgi:hypothetical protein
MKKGRRAEAYATLFKDPFLKFADALSGSPPKRKSQAQFIEHAA